MPSIIESKDYQTIQRHILEQMPRIERPASQYFSQPYLVVSAGSHYNNTLFVWDHYHMALRFATEGRPEYLLYLCENTLTHQDTTGFTPNWISQNNGPQSSGTRFHAQPFLARSAYMYFRHSGDEERVRALIPKLIAYLSYYDVCHLAPNGLHRWAWPFHSGFDNDPVTSFHLPDSIVSADLSSFLVLEFQALTALLKHFTPEKSAWSQARADDLCARIRTQLWFDEEETFAAFDLLRGKPMLSIEGFQDGMSNGKYVYQSCSNLIPLYAGIATPSQAQAMIERYVLNPDHFWSEWGIRSLSRSSEFYNNAVWGNPPRYGDHLRPTNSNWQGPVWIPLSFFMHRALTRYGFHADAQRLSVATHHVLATSLEKIGSFSENFCAETGRPLYARNFTAWNLLGDIFHESILGEFVD